MAHGLVDSVSRARDWRDIERINKERAIELRTFPGADRLIADCLQAVREAAEFAERYERAN